MAPLAKYRGRRYGGKKRTAGAKRTAVRKAGMRKSRAYAKRKPLRVARYNTMAGLLTNSLFKYRGPRLNFRVRAMKAVGAPNIWQANYSQATQVNAGRQLFTSFPTLQAEQLSDIVTNHLPSNTGPNRVVIQSAQTEVTFTNVTNAAAEVEIYDIMFKRDLSLDSSVNIGGYLYNFVNIEQMIKAGIQAGAHINPLATPPVPEPDTYIGASAFDSQIFKDYCRVVRKSHVMLASGASHRHQQLVGVNKLIDQTIAGNNDLIYTKGFTYATLLLIRGVGAFNPAVEPAGESTTNPLFLNVVTSVRIKYTYVQDVTSTLHYDDALPLGDAVNVRNIGSGAYETASP